MQRRNIWQLFSSLSASEANKFPLWLHLELGERQQYVQQLALYLSQHLTCAPSEEEVWTHLYQEAPYDDARLRKLMRDVARYLEEFLAIESFRQDQDRKDIYLLEAIHHRNRPELFQKTYRKLEKAREGRPFRNGAYFRKVYEMEGLYQKHVIKYQPKQKNSHLPALKHAFDGWWMHGKLELACLNVYHAQTFGHSREDLFLQEVLAFVNASPEYQKMNVLNIYKELFLILVGESDTNPDTIRTLAQHYGKQFSLTELKNIFGLLINFHIAQHNSTRLIYHIQELVSLYEWGIEEELVMEDNLINENHYKNILTTCLHLKEYSKAKKYLELLKDRLPPDIKEDVYLFNLSKYLFETGEYAQVVEVLRNIRFNNPIFEIPTRTTLIQAHYELSGPGQEWLLTLVDSLKRFVREQKIPPYHRKAYLNFLSLTHKMIQILLPRQLDKLATKLENSSPVYQQAWLKQKVKDRLLTKPV